MGITCFQWCCLLFTQITWHSGFTPPPAKLEIVRKLLANERNEVWILSGMGVQGGLEKIAAELPGVGLV